VRTVIVGVGNPVPVSVRTDRRFGLAGVAHAVAVSVRLIGIRRRRAVVARVADAVAVRVDLRRIGDRGVVPRVGDAVAVGIGLVRPGTGVADPITVAVG
jgi:hypothetical protein